MKRRPGPRWAWWGLAAAACVLVFMSYLHPNVVIDFGNRLVSCF